MKKFVVAASAMALLSLGALMAPVSALAQPVISVHIGAPPPPRFERVPPPRVGHVWAPGHWELRGRRHVWVNGVWLRARPGYVYRAPQWQQRGDRWDMHRGGWDRAHRAGPGPRDGYGRRDRYDRYYDGHRRNDRHGDAPQNPYRR